MARAVFGLSAEDVERLQQAIMSYGDGAEKVINNYLKAIINYIPVSNRNKQHAKDSSPLKAEQKENLSLYIHTKTQYNYLYFPQEAEGVHFQGKVPNDFMQHGVDAQYDNVVNNLLEKLQNNFK